MNWLVVALGGSLGAMARFGVSMLLPHVPGKLPWATFGINILGSFLMGVFFIVIIEKALLPPYWRHIIMIGFLGAFTTYSTFSMETFQLFHGGYWRMALAYMFLTPIFCVMAAISGYSLVNKLL